MKVFPHFGQVMRILPLPFGTRTVWRQAGHLKNLCVADCAFLAFLFAEPFLKGSMKRVRNHSYSARRAERLRLKVLNMLKTSAPSETRYMTTPMIVPAGLLMQKTQRQARRFSFELLERAILLCAETDYAMKHTGADDLILLEELLLQIMAEAKR